MPQDARDTNEAVGVDIDDELAGLDNIKFLLALSNVRAPVYALPWGATLNVFEINAPDGFSSGAIPNTVIDMAEEFLGWDTHVTRPVWYATLLTILNQHLIPAMSTPVTLRLRNETGAEINGNGVFNPVYTDDPIADTDCSVSVNVSWHEVLAVFATVKEYRDQAASSRT